jgi:t-SNARE complex subunit (syntaxin)
MSDMNGRGGDAVHDPNYILNELSALEVDIDKTLSSHIQKAKDAQKKAIIDRDLSGDSSKAADALTNVAVAYCKELVLRLDGIIHNPRSMEPRNRPTADRLRRKLHAVTQDLEAATMTYRQESTEGVARQIRITDRDMSVEDSRRNAETLLSGGPVQIFSQRVCLFPVSLTSKANYPF